MKTGAVSNLDERVKDEVEAAQAEQPKSKVESVIDDVLKEEKSENPEPAPTESQSVPSEPSSTNNQNSADTMETEIMWVETNMGRMSIQDYRDIKASQWGFDSYDELYNKGFRLGHGYDYDKAPESKSSKPKDASITDKGIREHLKEFNEKAKMQGDKSPIKVPGKALGKEQTK